MDDGKPFWEKREYSWWYIIDIISPTTGMNALMQLHSWHATGMYSIQPSEPVHSTVKPH